MTEVYTSRIIAEYTVYPKKYAHGFVVLCFVVVMQSFIMNSHEVFIHIHQGCFAGTGAIVRLPQCQWSKPDGYGKISQCITTTKHSKAKTVCIFLGIYCRLCRYMISVDYLTHYIWLIVHDLLWICIGFVDHFRDPTCSHQMWGDICGWRIQPEFHHEKKQTIFSAEQLDLGKRNSYIVDNRNWGSRESIFMCNKRCLYT